MIAAEHYSDAKELDAVLKRVEGGELLAYIIGEWYFWRHYFKLNADCLIPRPDTECLVETAIRLLKIGKPFVDLCTGSGCIGLSLLDERPDCPNGLMIDISQNALDAARENADLLGLSDRASFLCRDLINENPLGDKKFDLIVSNPPYIRTNDIKDFPSLEKEPKAALDGGEDGLIFYRRFLSAFADNLDIDGSFIFEIGYDQADDIRKIAAKYGFTAKIERDLGGNDRVAIVKRTTINQTF